MYPDKLQFVRVHTKFRITLLVDMDHCRNYAFHEYVHLIRV